MKTELFAEACRNLLPLEYAALSQSYYYDSLPLCVIDAVFSIGVRYTSVQNVVQHYCTQYGLRPYNLQQDDFGDTHTISQLIGNIVENGIEQSADRLFCNRQRTSSRNGILKTEAVLRFARVLQRFQIEKLADYRSKGLCADAEKEILAIPGQKSGLALRYFYMLAGDDTQAKPDRHVLRFLNAVSGETVSVQQAYELLTDVVKYLKPVYPHLTVRLLDYTIWNYMARGGTVQRMQSKYHKLVRDRIPEIIEADGKSCICETLADKDYISLLDRKLNEELAEYQESKSLEELADLLEVMQAVVKARGWTLEELEKVRADKAARRGGFEKKILLKEVQG